MSTVGIELLGQLKTSTMKEWKRDKYRKISLFSWSLSWHWATWPGNGPTPMFEFVFNFFGNISSFLLLSAPWGCRQRPAGPGGGPADQELPRCLLSLAEKEKNGNCIKILLIWSYMNEFDAWLEVARLNVLLITLKGWSVIQKSMYLPCLYNLSCLQSIKVS